MTMNTKPMPLPELEIILDQDMMKMGFRHFTYIASEGVHVYYSGKRDFEINRIGDLTSSTFRIFKGKAEVFFGEIPNLDFLSRLVIGLRGYSKK